MAIRIIVDEGRVAKEEILQAKTERAFRCKERATRGDDNARQGKAARRDKAQRKSPLLTFERGSLVVASPAGPLRKRKK